MEEEGWMQRAIRYLFIMAMLFTCNVSAEAVASYQKSNYDKVTTWNKMTDYFATIGKTDREKKTALRKRKSARKKKRIQKSRDKAKKEQIKRNKSLKSSYISQ